MKISEIKISPLNIFILISLIILTIFSFIKEAHADTFYLTTESENTQSFSGSFTRFGAYTYTGATTTGSDLLKYKDFQISCSSNNGDKTLFFYLVRKNTMTPVRYWADTFNLDSGSHNLTGTFNIGSGNLSTNEEYDIAFETIGSLTGCSVITNGSNNPKGELAVNDFSPINDNYKTRINWISPATSTASTTYTVQLQYYFNSQTHATSTFNKILLQICPINYNGECYESSANITYDNLFTMNMPVIGSPVAYVLGTANFWNGVEENVSCNWWEFWCEESTLIIGEGTSKRFNVATTTYSITTFMDVGKQTVINACEEDSNIATEAICKTLIWLFYPEDNTGNSLINLTNSLGNKVPFGYVKLLNEKVNNISATSTPWNNYIVDLGTSSPYSLGTIKIFDFSEAKNMIGVDNLNTITQWIINLMWIAFGIYITSRIMAISSKI